MCVLTNQFSRPNTAFNSDILYAQYRNIIYANYNMKQYLEQSKI